MAKINLTDAQQAVVDHRGGALLVSAAAGSGKTKVLVDRLLAMVCDPVSPKNVDDFLIITFTSAAAAELRSKIVKEISERLSEDAENRHLRNQLTRVYLAQISTVHSFCTNVLREYAHVLKLPADFRVCDETECKILKERVMRDVLNSVYEEIDALPDVAAFLDSLGYGRDDRKAATLIQSAYENSQSHAWPERWIDVCHSYLQRDDFHHISETVWGKYLLENTRELIMQQVKCMQEAREMLDQDPALEKYKPLFDDNIAMLQRLAEHGQWEYYHSLGTLSFGTLPRAKDFDVQIKTAVCNIRDTCKDLVKDRLKMFACDAETVLRDQLQTHASLRGLLEMCRRFAKAFADAKRKRRILDFSDLEHQMIRLLTDMHTGLPTASAKEIGSRFAEIMVDEYQDTNEAQDTIFSAISRNGENLFMVGDVKQSIYRFRLADPGIFLEKYKSYRQRENDGSIEPRKILLSANFRSRREVIDAVNHVFATVMSESVGDITYSEEERLSTERVFPDLQESAVELHCIEFSKDDGLYASKVEMEAQFVANRIQELISGEHYISDTDGVRRIRPDDIAILMRATSSTAPYYADALRRYNIPVVTEKQVNILDTAEVTSVLAYLRIIDNPREDIPLLTVLSGPICSFTSDELALIRNLDRSISFYDALLMAAEHQEKAAAFLADLEDFRAKSQWMTLTELFDYVLLKTKADGIFAAARGGDMRSSNLKRLREFCENTHNVGVDSLAAFIRHIDSMLAQNIQIPAAEVDQTGVTIMTVHKSKGLEFPVVFLSDLSRSFNREDNKSMLRMNSELYLACDVVDTKRMICYPSVAKRALTIMNDRQSTSEELRLLYVAMTRAKDRLIMSYCSDRVRKEMETAAIEAGNPANPSVCGTVRNPGKWVLLSAAIRHEAAHLFGGAVRVPEVPKSPWMVQFHTSEDVHPLIQSGVITDVEGPCAASVRCLSEIAEAYKTEFVPAKITATELKGRFVDMESAEEAHVSKAAPQIRARIFAPEEKALTPMQKGTALHLFMQYCRYECCATEPGVKEEICRLQEFNYISAAQAAAIEPEKILSFFQSELGVLVTGAQEMRREFKFSLLVDSADYFPNTQEEILLQGVVDCFVITKDGIVILDYKTDLVRHGAEQERAEVYRPQLTAYAKALERIFGLPVCRKILYFFATGQYFEL